MTSRAANAPSAMALTPISRRWGASAPSRASATTPTRSNCLILGGTWSAYSRDYREWFVQRCFDAMNAAGDPAYTAFDFTGRGAGRNVSATHRNVGLVIETRPDWITPDEIRHLRKLGVTKVQIGVQSLDDEILALNQRGHDVAAVRHALGLLRTAGFKLHLHWMPNLYGATPAKDRVDFARFFDDPAIRPDEMKIYPCSLIAGTELYDRWLAGSTTVHARRTGRVCWSM